MFGSKRQDSIDQDLIRVSASPLKSLREGLSGHATVEAAMRHYANLFRATLTALLMLVAIAGAAIASPFTEGYEAWQRGDYTEALKRYREGAEQGDAASQNALAASYYLGRGVPQDYAEAVKWYRKAAEQGDAGSQYLLGAMYAQGKGVPRDDAQAAKWYRKAAEQGEAEAQRYLGSMYYTGNAVPKDATEAVKWWRRAAEQGLAGAQYILGTMYAKGEGVPRDYVEAYKWIDLAVSRFPPSERETRDDAIGLRDALVRESMNPDEVALAKKLEHEWKPKPERSGQATITATAQSPARQPSFDCAKVKDRIAGVICSNSELAQWDARLGAAYKQKLSALDPTERAALRNDQRRWIASRNKQCNQGESEEVERCVLQATESRIAELAQQQTELTQQQNDQPLRLEDFRQGSTQETPNAPHFNLSCPKVDSVLRPLCELSEALLNNSCESIGDKELNYKCSLYLPNATNSDQYSKLRTICDADWIPIVAKECDARAARLEPRFREQLVADRKAKIALHRQQAKAKADVAFDAAKAALHECVNRQAEKLMVTKETGAAVAAAAINLCERELVNAAQAVAYRTGVNMWSQGPEPEACIEGSQRCEDIEKTITSTLLPALTAKVMQYRADAANSSPKASDSQRSRSDVFGTAFFITKDGAALTRAHVVDSCQKISVSFNHQQSAAQILARDDQNDLALLATNLQPTKTANWRLSVRQGEDVVVYGFPLTGVLASEGNVATGNITALAGLANDSRFLQVSAPVQPGNSGGPLFDRAGNVIGVVVAKLNAIGVAAATGDIPQNVNFAIKASVSAAFLDAQHVTYVEGESKTALATPDIADRAKNITLQVHCAQ
jgi:S1-C subfamily serine protease/uncharacterized protein YecT (DUF1311 family)